MRIVEEGELGAGDHITVTARPEHAITTRMVSDAILLDPSLLPPVQHANELPSDLRAWIADRIAARQRRDSRS